MQNRIAIIGDFIADDYRDCSCDRISPESPSPVLIQKRNFIRAGGAANVAVNYSQLEGEAHFYFLKLTSQRQHRGFYFADILEVSKVLELDN